MAAVGRFIKRAFGQKAQAMVEYALVIAFVVAVAAYFISSSNPVGEAVNNTFDSAQQRLNSGE